MSTAAIIALEHELRDAETALKQRQADSAEAISLGQRAQAVVDAAQRKVNELTDAVVDLKKIHEQNQGSVRP